MDQDVINLAKSIRQVESGGDFNAKGKSGESGAYQWTPDTWKAHAKDVLGNENAPMTPDNQNAVAYTILKKRKDAGLNPAQIAAEWNSGSATGWENKVGVNDKGVEYNVPKYVKNVTDTYQQMKGLQQPAQTQQTTTPKQETSKKSLPQKALEFAFPILEKKERTPLQTAGDIGLSALWFIPGVGTEASIALRGLGLGAKTARVGGLLAAGAGIGYGADVSSKLSEGKTGEEVLKPGIGTGLGLATAGLGSRIASKYSQKGVLDAIAKENNSVFAQTKTGAKKLSESFSRQKDPGKFLSERGINLKKLIDPDTISYDTKDVANKIVEDASKLNKVLTDTLAKVPESKPVSEIEQSLLARVPKNYPERADIINREMDLLRKQYGETPLVADLNEWKQRAWNMSKFDMAIPNEIRNTYRFIGNELKKDVEKLADKAGVKGVRDFNDLVGSHFDTAGILEKLHGTKAKGGRLGNTLMENSLRTIGGIGGFAGGGPLTSIAGVIAGHYGAKSLEALMRFAEGSPIKSSILKRIQREEPEIVKKFVELSKKTPSELEALKQQLKAQGIDIFKEKGLVKVPTRLSPQPQKTGLIQGLLNTGASRAGTQ